MFDKRSRTATAARATPFAFERRHRLSQSVTAVPRGTIERRMVLMYAPYVVTIAHRHADGRQQSPAGPDAAFVDANLGMNAEIVSRSRIARQPNDDNRQLHEAGQGRIE